MKVKLKKPVNWFGPYQLAEAICFWAKKEKDEIGIDREPEWVHNFGTSSSATSGAPCCLAFSCFNIGKIIYANE